MVLEACGSLMRQWCLEEFAGIDLGDERLNRRFLQTAVHLAQLPQASIGQACQTKAAIKGAYRLLSNELCDRDEILRTHVAQTLNRIQALGGHPRVLVIQDTTVLQYGSHRATRGLGRTAPRNAGLGESQGLITHTALVVTPEGLSLGLIDQRTWARDNPDFHHVLLGERESSKWHRSLDQTHRLLPPSIDAVTIADREADITKLMQRAVTYDRSFVIRAKDRTLKGSEHQWLRRHLEHEPSVHAYSLEVPVRTSQHSQRKLGTRIAQVEVRFGEVQLRTDRQGGALPLYAVLVSEEHPSEGVEDPVVWILLTNVEVKSARDALERIRWYQQRWHIETFHKVLKSGCTVEQARLGEAQRLDRYVTLMSVIAWRLYWLTHVSRVHPKDSCEQALSPEEWKLLHFRIHPGASLPETPPTLREVTHWIGHLGGFQGGNKKYPDPGVTTLWRGFQRLNDMIEGYHLAMQRGA